MQNDAEVDRAPRRDLLPLPGHRQLHLRQLHRVVRLGQHRVLLHRALPALVHRDQAPHAPGVGAQRRGPADGRRRGRARGRRADDGLPRAAGRDVRREDGRVSRVRSTVVVFTVPEHGTSSCRLRVPYMYGCTSTRSAWAWAAQAAAA